jgi:hypothetical protein
MAAALSEKKGEGSDNQRVGHERECVCEWEGARLSCTKIKGRKKKQEDSKRIQT